jgi:large subunit ribosomal protein L19
MSKKIEIFLKPFLKENLSEVRPGDTVSVYQKIREGEKEKIQTFEGVVIARKHGKEIGATITVRKVISGIGVERIFPLHSPTIEKIEILKRGKVRRAKLYYLRKAKGKKGKLKKREFTNIADKEQSPEEISEIPQA